MATEKDIALNIKVKFEGANTVQELEDVLKEINKEMENVDENSHAFAILKNTASKATKEIQELNTKIKDLNGESKTVKSGMEGLKGSTELVTQANGKLASSFENVTSNGGAIAILDSLTGGLATKLKDAFEASKLFNFSLKGMSKALIATGIGAFVVLLGLAVAYWDDIVGLVSGVSSEQKKLNAEVEDNVAAQQEALDAISEQENSLRLQGKTEDEIRQLKIAQTEEVIKATMLQLEQMKATKKAQVEAAQRNKDIAQGIIRFLTLPLTTLLKTVDMMTAAISKIPGIDIETNLEEAFSGGIAGMIFDPEEIATEADATIEETEKALIKLKNQKDGFILQSQKADQDAADKAKADREKAAADREKAAADAQAQAEKQAADREKAEKQAEEDREKEFSKAISDLQDYYADRNLIISQNFIDGLISEREYDSQLSQLEDEHRQAELIALDDYGKDKTQKEQEIADKVIAIKKDENAKIAELKTKEIEEYERLTQERVDLAKSLYSDLKALSQTFFDDTEEGQKKAFEFNKMVAIAETLVSTYLAAQKAYASQMSLATPDAPFRAAVAAGLAVASGLARVATIQRTQFNSTSPSGGDGGGDNTPSNSTLQRQQSTTPNVPIIETGGEGQKIKVYVTETDIRNTTKKMTSIYSKAIVTE